MIIATDFCVFHDGVHYSGRFCPHGRTEDELGPVQPAGWTAQQANYPTYEEQDHG